MMQIHTIAAGGGSLLYFRNGRFQVGPDSAGANPGPAAYRSGGPLTVTDCNVLLGRIQSAYFPHVFGENGDQSLDVKVVAEKFQQLTDQIQHQSTTTQTPEQVAEGFLRVAVNNMVNAINKISLQRGYDVTSYTLCCFGGAGGQHACQVADALGIETILLHPYAGVLSAYGMGLAALRLIKQQAVEAPLTENLVAKLKSDLAKLQQQGSSEMQKQGVAASEITAVFKIHIKYEGTDTPLLITFGHVCEIKNTFEDEYLRRYGFIMADKTLMVESISVEVISATEEIKPITANSPTGKPVDPTVQVRSYFQGQWLPTPLFERHKLTPKQVLSGPAIIVEANSTTWIEPNWQAEITVQNNVLLKRKKSQTQKEMLGTKADPVMLEVFNNLFMSIAEQMGIALANTAYSVNIKERLDFSCAVFDSNGDLVANAPHIPVHLGSMSESVKAIIHSRHRSIQPGDVFMLNNPYHGGTHLPDVTVITPVFINTTLPPLFYVWCFSRYIIWPYRNFGRIRVCRRTYIFILGLAIAIFP